MNERYGEEVPKWLRMLGAWRVNKDSVDFKWGYFAPRPGLELMFHRGGYFDSQMGISFCLGWGHFNIKLPFHTKLKEGCDLPHYGIQVHSDTFWLHYGGVYDESWGQVTKDRWVTWHIPWFNWEFDDHWILGETGFYVSMKGEQSWEWRKENALKETHPYTYKLKNGEIQQRTATISQEKRQWHRKWFPFVKRVHESIDIEFNDEVGERTGSWKGGTIGCGYDMLPGEQMIDTLRRMEKERKFT